MGITAETSRGPPRPGVNDWARYGDTTEPMAGGRRGLDCACGPPPEPPPPALPSTASPPGRCHWPWARGFCQGAWIPPCGKQRAARPTWSVPAGRQRVWWGSACCLPASPRTTVPRWTSRARLWSLTDSRYGNQRPEAWTRGTQARMTSGCSRQAASGSPPVTSCPRLRSCCRRRLSARGSARSAAFPGISTWARTMPRRAAHRCTRLIRALCVPPAGTRGAAGTGWRWITATDWSPPTTTWNPVLYVPARWCARGRPSPGSEARGGPPGAICISKPS